MSSGPSSHTATTHWMPRVCDHKARPVLYLALSMYDVIFPLNKCIDCEMRLWGWWCWNLLLWYHPLLIPLIQSASSQTVLFIMNLSAVSLKWPKSPHGSSSLAALSHWQSCSHGGSSPYLRSCDVGLADALAASSFGAMLKLHWATPRCPRRDTVSLSRPSPCWCSYHFLVHLTTP